MVQNFTRDILPRKNIIFAQIHKSAGMLLQYSGAALMRNGLSNSPVVMGDYYEAKNNVKTEYHCGECSQPLGNDDELWIGCDEQRNGWYHAVCVCMEEGSLQTISTVINAHTKNMFITLH